MNEYGKEVAKKMESYMGNADSVAEEISDIQNAQKGVEVRGALAAGVKKAFDKSKTAQAKSEEATEITQNLLDDSFDSSKINQNFEQRLNDEIENLQPKWTDFKDDTVNQFKEDKIQRNLIDDWAFYKALQLNREMKPLLVLVDDDGQKTVVTKLLPIAQEYNVPISIAIVTSLPEQNLPTHLNLEELKQLQETGLFEIVSHTETHKNLAELSKKQRESELLNSKLWLREHGFEHNIIVYPYGGWSQAVANDTRKYYASGINIDSGSSQINTAPIDTYNIQRVYIDKGVSTAKSRIDQAIANKSLMILGMHSWYGQDRPYPFKEEELREIIEYAQAQNIEIVTLKEALQTYGNVIDFPNFKMGSNGESTGTIGMLERSPLPISADTPLTDFKPDKITYLEFSVPTAKTANLPEAFEGNYGFLITIRIKDSELYGYQKYTLINSNNIYERRWDFDRHAWNKWVKTEAGGKVQDSIIPVNNSTPLTDFESNKITLTKFSVPQAKAADMPEANDGKLGFLTTYRVDSSELYGYQEYRITNSPETNPIYTRVWDFNNHIWHTWILK